MKNIYAELCITVQALRRHCEGLRTPLAPATGVAAFIYTHQVANVYRVLTDVRVRHLLADEVGLGKTVQALMILNALRYERKELRVLVIVPDRLVTQWRDEILTRGHTAPIDDKESCEGSQYIRLVWDARLKGSNPAWTLADIDPARYDVLVVDELHTLRADVQRRVVSVSPAFEHLLLLTATPAFQDPKRHSDLFAMLEPERSLLAAATRDKDCDIVQFILERDRRAARLSSKDELPFAALAHCAYRRIIRTRRADYRGVLPRRNHIPLVIDPLGVEEDRQQLMWKYCEHLGDISLDLDRVKLAKRVILSPPSLEQRVDFLRRRGHEREGILKRAKPLVHRRQGDSRADALVELLARVWRKNTSERVLVAAQDNLTVDYLFEIVRNRLPRIGPLGTRVPLVAARIRQGMMVEAVEDLAGFGNKTNENLEEFQRGDAQVLFAPDAAQVGLNLQCARVLVLYSVPWQPQEVEQWIGRLDRIGNASIFASDGAARNIDVYTIVQRGLVDEKVVTVLQRFHAFERSVNLDGAHLGKMVKLIEAAALSPRRTNWRRLEDNAAAMAAEDEVKELNSELQAFLPWTVDWAWALRRQLDALPPTPLMISESDRVPTGPASWDRCMEGMFKLLDRAKEYSIRLNKDPTGRRFRSLWYRFGELGMYGDREVLSNVVFSFGADPGKVRSPKHAHAFITRRGDIDAPPRRHVEMKIEDGHHTRRPLHFVNFGNSIHDELVCGWSSEEADSFALDVVLPEHHAFFRVSRPGLYVIRLAILDPASWLHSSSILEDSIRAIEGAASQISRKRYNVVMPKFLRAVRCALEADIRWMRSQLTAVLVVQGLKLERWQWARMMAEEISALLNPLDHDEKYIPRATEWQQTEAQISSIDYALIHLRSRDSQTAAHCWSSRFSILARALAARLFVVREEAKDAVQLARTELAKARAALTVAQDRHNASQITRTKNERDSAKAIAEMTKIMWNRREEWLTQCRTEVQTMRPEERLTVALRVGRKLSSSRLH